MVSITDELREWGKDLLMASDRLELKSIADRIDAAHRSALEKLAAQVDSAEPDRAEPEEGVSWKEEARTWERYCKELITERDERYIPLPVDADGVPIHVGDVMEWPTTGETFEVVGIGDGTLFYVDGGCDECADWTGASTKRHHHAPTVEDVLREFADRVCNSGHQWGLDAADTIAEYAKRLRLAKEVDE